MLLELASEAMQLPIPLLVRIGRRSDFMYKEYEIPKRTAGYRTIHHPSRALKAAQRWLLSTVISELPVHSSAFAYRTGVGIRAHAEFHRGARFLLRMDFNDFFHSLTDEDLRRVIASQPTMTAEWSDQDVDWFLRIVCRKRRLTIGAPSSPALSNALMVPFDESINARVGPKHIKYSRYADDLVFSAPAGDLLGQVKGEVEALLREIPYPTELSINHSKTIHSSTKRRQVVTGLVLTTDGGVSAGRPLKRKVRALLHKLELITPEERKWLRGILGHLKAVDPKFVNRLALKYGSPKLRIASQARESPSAGGSGADS